MALQEGQTLGAYRILAQQGQGGMATIYKAYHDKLDRYVAIKFVHPALAQDPTFLTRFQREARIVARLEHPHIVPIYDFADHEGQPYLVMKFIDGQTLKAVIADETPLPVDRVTQIMTPIAAALDYAHGQGVLHRDIKPSNIIIGADGMPYLTDFGLARIAGAGESTLSQDLLIGTPQYISPEQAMGKQDIDARADLYSLGVVLYELVVGQTPFNADTPYAVIHDHIYSPLPQPSKLNPDIPKEVEAVLIRALAKDPAARYESAGAMMTAFQDAVVSSGMTRTPGYARTPEATTQRQDLQPTLSPIPAPPAPSSASFPPGIPAALMPLAERELRRAERRARHDERRKRKDRSDDDDDDDSRPGVNWGNVQQWWGLVEQFVDEEKRDVPYNDEESIRRRVEKQIKKRREFFGHLATYIGVNLMLIMINAGTGAFLGGEDGNAFTFPWSLIVLLAWGSGLAAHAVEMYYTTGERAAASERLVRQEMHRLYGDNWTNSVTRRDYYEVRRRVTEPSRKRQEFISHLAVFIPINLMLIGINAATGNWFSGGSGFPWSVIVLLGWGMGLVAHAIEMFTKSGKFAEKQEQYIRREIEREREMIDGSLAEKPKRDAESARVRLTADGELTDSMVSEWEQDEKRKNSL